MAVRLSRKIQDRGNPELDPLRLGKASPKAMRTEVIPAKGVLPGGILVSRVRIYDTVSPDGQRGGTPHIHLASDEMYYCLSGQGAVEIIDWEGFKRYSIAPGEVMSFTPGTIHRAINLRRDLTILVIMQNKGLPEQGDVAICFPRTTLSSRATYEKRMSVFTDEDAFRRRDLGVEGFLDLKSTFERSLKAGRELLDRFYRRALENTRKQLADWRQVIETGPAVEVQRSRDIITTLESGSIVSLRRGRGKAVCSNSRTSFGYCGYVESYHPGKVFNHIPEGLSY